MPTEHWWAVLLGPVCARMPDLKSSYRPAWWLPGPHLPTIWGKFGRRQPLMHDRLERWATPDGDHLTIARTGVARAGVPHLLVLHGLEGKLTANYAHGLLQQARAHSWSADLMMFRSCDGEVNSARRFYHSGETTDLDFVVRRLIAGQPESPLYIVGVSLGGNVTLKWLGEQGTETPPQVKAAAGVSVPFDLAAGSRFLERGFGAVYVRHFIRSLTAKIQQKMVRFPDLVDPKALRKARTFWEFDNLVTGPLHGFRDAADYYERSSSIRYLDRITVPTLLLSALDDPFLPLSVLDRVREIAIHNPYLHAVFTRRGGHVGWIEGAPWNQSYYMERQVIEWLYNV